MRLAKRQKTTARLLTYALTASLIVPALPFAVKPALAMDTDIFTAQNTPGATPNVLIVLDNTSNWSRQNQKWPGGIDQGQSEVNAIKSVIQNLPGNINIGMLEFVTGGPATDNGGYVRFAISPMGKGQGDTATTNRTNFSSTLTTIYNNISSPNEKQSSNVAYGNLMYDAYNYFAGATPFAASADVVSSLADSKGYTSNYTRFKSPLSAATSCGTNYIIFIGNTAANGPGADLAANTAALAGLGGDTTQLKLPVYTQTTQTIGSNLGYTNACYSSAPTAVPSEYAAQCPIASSNYDSCTVSNTDSTTALNNCPTGSLRYPVISTTPTATVSSSTVGTPVVTTSASNVCYSSTSQWTNTDKGTLTCPASTSSSQTVLGVTTTTTTNYSCSYSVSNTVASSCTLPTLTNTALSTSCYTGISTGNKKYSSAINDRGGLTCPAGYTCSYGSSNMSTNSTSCPTNQQHVNVVQTAVPNVSGSKYTVTQTATPTTTVSTVTGSTSTTLGNTSACYSSQPTGTPSGDYTCPTGSTCTYGTSGATNSGTCPTGTARYQVLGNSVGYVETPAGTFKSDTNPFNSDEWARFMAQTGVPVTGGSNQTINTYTIDVYKNQPNAEQSGLLAGMATAGGGKYFTATSEQAIVNALTSIFAEIQAVNTTFASASLPISATNRSQNENQVYIGMFRPDPTAHPRWYGNLKRYQLGVFSGATDLADVNGIQAVSSTTGFITPCAVSAWTTDSGSYWYDTQDRENRIFITERSGSGWDKVANDTKFARGLCGTTGIFSDLPDGPTVEKGGAAQMIRNQAGSRNVKTLSGSSLVTFNTTNVPSLSTNTVNFIRGQDVTGEIKDGSSSAMRPSIHGDVIHSRPLPVNYGGSTGVVVYYGANDGTYRGFSDTNKVENWSFVAPESFSTLSRLMDNTPLVQTPSPTPPGDTAIEGTTPKNFFFDGSTGLYQNADNSKVWIYPAMRRGGRMLYSFDVTNPNSPSFKWKVGCPNQTNDTGCTTTTIAGIGQTWSTPAVAFVPGYSTTTPVVVVGGGYSTCEDTDSATTSCASSPKGAKVYVLNGDTGALIKSFDTDRSVAADVSLIDINLDGNVDAAYVADTGGNLYRIDFSSPSSSFAARAVADWTITKVAYTNTGSRKFLFGPAVFPYQNSVYLAITSGDREHPLSASYPYTTPVTNRFYVYLDNPLRTTTSSAATNLDGSNMIDNTYKAGSTTEVTSCTSPKLLPNNADSKYGWFMNLNANGVGEQGVTSALIAGGMVAFSTNRPVVSGASCTTSLGEARGYWVSLLNGSGAIASTGSDTSCGGARSSVFLGGGLAPSPVVGVVTINGKAQVVIIGAAQRGSTLSASALSGQQLRPPTETKRTRTYWRTNSDSR